MTQCKAIIEYDGAAYGGWQIQKNAPSIQEELEKALFHLSGERIRVRGAGRTDAGVHARGQVAAFTAPPGVPIERLARAINSRLPDDIAVVSAVPADDAFDPRRDCALKQYSYSLSLGHIRPALGRGQTWHVKWNVDADRMLQAAPYFVGTHDFTSFANRERGGEDNIRTIERCDLVVGMRDRAGRTRLDFRIEGRSFLYNMVRAIVGTLVDIGAGRLPPEAIPEILEEKSRAAAGQSAPPRGLCLEWVLYPGDDRPAADR
ncbi:MAG: tRNA pseudouridine(38-40) synthase TruA [Planctomycetota bacterium]|jgi:tRNA pseudouridine38-40 synthase|nr:tRNA pseudouridine(38-40) synthase TruA [Planctomycetota bacterium]